MPVTSLLNNVVLLGNPVTYTSSGGSTTETFTGAITPITGVVGVQLVMVRQSATQPTILSSTLGGVAPISASIVTDTASAGSKGIRIWTALFSGVTVGTAATLVFNLSGVPIGVAVSLMDIFNFTGATQQTFGDSIANGSGQASFTLAFTPALVGSSIIMLAAGSDSGASPLSGSAGWTKLSADMAVGTAGGTSLAASVWGKVSLTPSVADSFTATSSSPLVVNWAMVGIEIPAPV